MLPAEGFEPVSIFVVPMSEYGIVNNSDKSACFSTVSGRRQGVYQALLFSAK
jgi:hypothetical protein